MSGFNSKLTAMDSVEKVHNIEVHEEEAQKTQDKVRRKRVLVLPDSSDEDDYPLVKKPKTGYTRPEDVSMDEYESEEELHEHERMDNEGDEFDDGRRDYLCSFCDDGGYLLCCDGPCMRSFHPRPEDGINTECKTLGYPDGKDIKESRKDWFCKNCETKKHQCFVCWELGDSDDILGSKRQVFVCDIASCGKFYHPECVASKVNTIEREALANGIWAGEEHFTCPQHMCKECGKGEEKQEKDLNLATCRLCPAAWHLKCLPRTLSFYANEESQFEVRAWKVGKRYIVYCTNHKTLGDLGTPKGNHIKFEGKSPQKEVNVVGIERAGSEMEGGQTLPPPSSPGSEMEVGEIRPSSPRHEPPDFALPSSHRSPSLPPSGPPVRNSDPLQPHQQLLYDGPSASRGPFYPLQRHDSLGWTPGGPPRTYSDLLQHQHQQLYHGPSAPRGPFYPPRRPDSLGWTPGGPPRTYSDPLQLQHQQLYHGPSAPRGPFYPLQRPDSLGWTPGGPPRRYSDLLQHQHQQLYHGPSAPRGPFYPPRRSDSLGWTPGGPPRRNSDPLQPQHQQLYDGPSASRDPIYPPGTTFQGHDDDDCGGWLPD